MREAPRLAVKARPFYHVPSDKAASCPGICLPPSSLPPPQRGQHFVWRSIVWCTMSAFMGNYNAAITLLGCLYKCSKKQAATQNGAPVESRVLLKLHMNGHHDIVLQTAFYKRKQFMNVLCNKYASDSKCWQRQREVEVPMCDYQLCHRLQDNRCLSPTSKSAVSTFCMKKRILRWEKEPLCDVTMGTGGAATLLIPAFKLSFNNMCVLRSTT